MRAAAALLVLSLGACAPSAPAPAEPLALDCALGFEALAAAVAAQPGLTPAPAEKGEPYRFLNGGGVAYVITQPGAPAHPAVLRQRSVGGQMQDTGCAFGDPAAFEALKAYLDSLRAGRP